MDPRQKLDYYVENMFGEEFINMYKKQITDLWEKEYKPAQQISNPPDESDVLASYMYKKRKFIQIDELNNYLNSPPIDYKANVLEYWKVNYKIYLLYSIIIIIIKIITIFNFFSLINQNFLTYLKWLKII